MAVKDEGKAAGRRRAQADDAKGEQAGGRVSGAQDSREGPEAELGRTFAQPAPDLDNTDTDTAEAKSANLGEGTVSVADGVAAAQAGNEQVADNFEPEQVRGFHGHNPAAERNIHHTVAGHLEYAKLSPEEQYEVRRALHEEDQARFRADDWS